MLAQADSPPGSSKLNLKNGRGNLSEIKGKRQTGSTFFWLPDLVRLLDETIIRPFDKGERKVTYNG